MWTMSASREKDLATRSEEQKSHQMTSSPNRQQCLSAFLSGLLVSLTSAGDESERGDQIQSPEREKRGREMNVKEISAISATVD